MPTLRHASPDEPGWTRRRAGAGWSYRDLDGRPIQDDRRERIEALVIPPAWSDVWICPDPDAHLQAVGTDDAGRKQYLYHDAWTEQQSREKFDRVLEFGACLAKAREVILTDLRRDGMPRERACAAAVRLMDLGYFRIGNDVYADTNGSFGLTTLERRHVRRQQDHLVFTFVGKSGVDHRVEIDDVLVVEAVQAMRRRRAVEDPRLLAYKDTRRWHALVSGLVNEYVRESTGHDATAKDFRTWHATVLAAAALAATDEAGETEASRKRAVSATMREVSQFLGNTPALARSSYVDPRVVEAYQEGRTIAAVTARQYDTPDERQAALELATLRLLR